MIVYTAEVNMGMHITVLYVDLESFEYITRDRVAGSYVRWLHVHVHSDSIYIPTSSSI